MASDERFALLEVLLRRRSDGVSQRTGTEIKTRQTVSEWGAVKVSPKAVLITIESKSSADLHKWIADHPNEALKALHDAQKKSEQQ
ncbi:MAG: hypothetical protein B7Y02_00755 [Rhodobacterales bacterium 17-64-5]|nr:MAG: hypothetical protein B7Y02_00755 [Rhodobacterales bacterium 17-64-5]